MSCDKLTKHLQNQIWTCSGVLISVVNQGIVLGYATRLLPELIKPESEIKADLQDVSWMASSPTMAIVLGALISSILMEVLGRKIAYMILMTAGSIGLLQIYTAWNASCVLSGLILSKVSAAGVVILAAVVIGEYSDPRDRGMFLHLKTAALSFGTVMFHMLGYYYHWRTIALVILTTNVMSSIIVSTWLESPAWLAKKGKIQQSERNFCLLRGPNQEAKNEFVEMIKIHTNLSLKANPWYLDLFRKIIKRSFLRPVFIMFMCSVLLELSGRHIVPTYASNIMEKIGVDKCSPFLNVWIDVIITISAILSAFLIKVMNTRTLLFSTGATSLVILLTASTCLFLSANRIITNSFSMPRSMLTLYLILVNLGCTIIPLALPGEIFPLAHKGAGIFVSEVFSCIFIEATLKSFPYLLAGIKIYSTFAMSGMIKTVILMTLFFVLPETKNKTLKEIEDSIQYGKAVGAKNVPYYDDSDRMLKLEI